MIKTDFAFMASNVLLVRVGALPLGSSVEIEMNCDSTRIESDKLDKLWCNFTRQRYFKTIAEYEAANQDIKNTNGEVYYEVDKVSRNDIVTRRGKQVNAEMPQSNVLGVTGIIPALNIINVFTGESFAICERYNSFC